MHRHAIGERAETGEGRSTFRPDPSGCRAKHAAEQRWVGAALALHGRAKGRGQHDRAIHVARIAKAGDKAILPPYEGDENSRT